MSNNSFSLEIDTKPKADVLLSSQDKSILTITTPEPQTLKITNNSGGGTSNYNMLSNKPSINGVELQGDITTEDLGISASI